MEGPDPPSTVEHFQPATNSRPCPVSWTGEGSFQAAYPGKYNFYSSFSILDAFTTSSVPLHLTPTSPSNISSLGRTAESITEAPDPSTTVEPVPPATYSRPGPVCVSGDGVFQPITYGKYEPPHDNPAADPLLGFSSPKLPRTFDVLMYYQNLGGINSSLVEYQLACSDACYDIYAFTETWLNGNTLSHQLFDHSYTVYRQDRSPLNSNKSIGGGVLLAVRSCYSSRLLSPPECSTVEQLWVSITASDATLYICVLYIPPDRVSDDSLIEKHLRSLEWIVSQMSVNDNLVILGDFNLRDICWQRNTRGFYFPLASRSVINPVSSNLLDAYSIARLGQLNGIRNLNNRMLDLCFVSEELCSNCHIIPAPSPLVKSCRHHSPLLINMKLCVRRIFNETIESIFYNFDKANFNSMNEFLLNVNWEDSLGDCDTNLAASLTCNILLYAIDQFVPKRIKRGPTKPAWSNSVLKRLKKLKRAALRKHSKYHSDSTKTCYSKANADYKQLNSQLYHAYQAQLQRRLKSNPKSFWHHVNTQRKESGLPSSMTNGIVEADTIAGIADLFREQFYSVFNNERISTDDISAAANNVTPSTLSSRPFSITGEMVITAGKQLKSSTRSGPDGVPSLVLKRCLAALAVPLAYVFNLSLTSGIFPACWKDSFLFPIHKKGCKRTISNYRGIASLSATSKLFELIILDNLAQNFAHCISPDQHGFMPKRSTTTNLTTFTSFIIREIERGHQVDAIYTDLSAAFDKINHDIALAKYDKVGVHDNLLAWLHSYLTGRSMCVKIGDFVSSSFPMTSGVPQGSHLGPFLFLLYMNDVNRILKCLKLSYADDLKLYSVIRGPSDANFLQQQLDVFAEWCRINRMTLNVLKCSVISFGRKRSLFHHDYTLSGITLNRESTIKDLGILIDSKLNFKDHVAYVVSKASSQLGFIFRFAKTFKDVYCLKALFCSLVRPILEYSAVVWSPSYQNDSQRIERVQRKFIRYALRHLHWNDPLILPSYDSRCMLINLERLDNRRNVAMATFVGDLLQGNIDCSTLLGSIDINTRRRNLRSHAFLGNPFSRTNYGMNEPMRRMCRVFNRCYIVFDFSVSRYKNKCSFRRFLC